MTNTTPPPTHTNTTATTNAQPMATYSGGYTTTESMKFHAMPGANNNNKNNVSNPNMAVGAGNATMMPINGTHSRPDSSTALYTLGLPPTPSQPQGFGGIRLPQQQQQQPMAYSYPNLQVPTTTTTLQPPTAEPETPLQMALPDIPVTFTELEKLEDYQLEHLLHDPIALEMHAKALDSVQAMESLRDSQRETNLQSAMLNTELVIIIIIFDYYNYYYYAFYIYIILCIMFIGR
jgi:hypothetical protein